MRAFVLILAVASYCCAGRSLRAQMVPSRYLIVVDSSSSMGRQKDAVPDTVCSLILSAFDGQIAPGESVAIWTFNDRVLTDQFPVQSWSSETRTRFNEQAALFLRKLRYERNPRMDRLVSSLEKAVELSNPITIFVVSNGEVPFAGTPFDDSINAIYQEHGKQLRARKKPFVTVLIGENGRLTQWAVYTGGTAVAVPRLSPRPPGSAPPLLRAQATNAPAKRLETDPAPRPVRTNDSLVASSPQNISSSPATAGTASPEAARERVSTVKPEASVPPAEAIVEKTEPALTATKAAITNAPVVEKGSEKFEKLERPETVEIVPPAPEPTPSKPVAKANESVSPALVLSNAPAAQATQVSSPPPIVVKTAEPDPPRPSEPLPQTVLTQKNVIVRDVPTPITPALTHDPVSATPPRTSSGTTLYLTIGAVLVLTGIGLGFWFLRKPAGETSLISRSLDKNRP